MGVSSHVQLIVDAGSLQILVRLLRVSDPQLVELAVRALGNVAGDNASFRDAVLAFADVYPAMKDAYVAFPHEITLLRELAWALGNLCRNVPHPPLPFMVSMVPLLHSMAHSSDLDTSLNALWAISYISDVSVEGIQAILDAGLSPLIVATLSHPLVACQAAAIKNIRNLVSGSAAQVQYLLEQHHASLIPALVSLITHPKLTIRREVLWTFVRIARHSSSHVPVMLQAAATLIPTLMASLTTANDELWCEVGRVFLQVLRHDEDLDDAMALDHVTRLLEAQAIPLFCVLLSHRQSIRSICTGLDGLTYLFRHAQRNPAPLQERIRTELEAVYGYDTLEAFLHHPRPEIRRRIHRVWTRYLHRRDEGDDDNGDDDNDDESDLGRDEYLLDEAVAEDVGGGEDEDVDVDVGMDEGGLDEVDAEENGDDVADSDTEMIDDVAVHHSSADAAPDGVSSVAMETWD